MFFDFSYDHELLYSGISNHRSGRVGCTCDGNQYTQSVMQSLPGDVMRTVPRLFCDLLSHFLPDRIIYIRNIVCNTNRSSPSQRSLGVTPESRNQRSRDVVKKVAYYLHVSVRNQAALPCVKRHVLRLVGGASRVCGSTTTCAPRTAMHGMESFVRWELDWPKFFRFVLSARTVLS